MRALNCLVKRRMNQMDTGENKLSTEMMKKMYESYKLHQKEDYEKFVEDCKKIIHVSDRGCSDTENILKLVEGTPITDNHERRIHDLSIYKLHGRQVLHTVFDKPFPVMMPEDVKDMEENIMNHIVEKFRGFSHPVVFDEDGYIITGATKNFKPQQTYDQLETLCDILDTEGPDRNGRIWKREFLKRFSTTRFPLITPRGHKSWLWLKIMDLQKSYEINLMQTLETTLSTKVDLKSVINMKWQKPEMSDMKAHNFRYGKMWQDQALINYATEDVSHIDTIILDSLATFGPDINSAYGISTPNLNDIDKKKLERVIKKGKRKK